MNDRPYRPRRHGSSQPAAGMRMRRSPDLIDPWRLIQRRHSGLLRYARARGAVSLPVIYTARDHRLYVRLPVYNDACNFLDRADVALDVDASSAGRVLIARVAGTGLMVPDSIVPTELTQALEEWPEDLPTRVLVLVPEFVSHIPVADDARYPPLPQTEIRLPGTFADT